MTTSEPRLTTAFSIDEKQLQRQISKTDVSSNFLKESASLTNAPEGGADAFTDSAAHFSRKELAGLFKMRGEGEGCDTLAVLGAGAWADARGAVASEGGSVMSSAMAECGEVIAHLHES